MGRALLVGGAAAAGKPTTGSAGMSTMLRTLAGVPVAVESIGGGTHNLRRSSFLASPIKSDNGRACCIGVGGRRCLAWEGQMAHGAGNSSEGAEQFRSIGGDGE